MTVKMSFDLTGVDTTPREGFEPYEGDVPKPGIYNAEIRSVRMRTSAAGNTYFNVLLVLGPDGDKPEKNKYIGCPVWERVVPGDSDVQKERLAKFFKAVSGRVKVNVEHDPVDEGGRVTKIGGKDPVGVKVRAIVTREMFNGEPQPRVSELVPWDSKKNKWPTNVVAEKAVDEEEDEDVVAEDEEEDDEGVDVEAAIAAREAELAKMDRAQLKTLLKGLDSAFKVLKRHTDDELRSAIIDLEFPEDEVDGDGDEAEEGTDEAPF